MAHANEVGEDDAVSDPRPSTDPILVARARWDTLAKLGRRIGSAAFLVALVAFLAAAATGYPVGLVRVVTGALVIGTIVLCPAIVLGYMVRAARDDDPLANT